MNILKKYKAFMSDMLLNIIGFAIYIFAQQIILLPLLAKMVTDEIYSGIVLYISILNVVCNVTGGELGNVRIIRDSEYRNKKIKGDFSNILLIISPIIAVVLFPIFLFYMKYTILGSILLILTILFANIRLYATCYYRLERKYYHVIGQNITYLLGIIIGLILYKITNNFYILLFIPETISIIYALKYSDILQMKLAKTVEMINTTKKLFQLGFVSLLTNLMAYFDKFLIYPMFGPATVAVYYAVNSMSKIANLITNPIANVILSWVSGKEGESNKNKIIKATLIANIPIIIMVTIITIPLTYLALKVLYSQYLNEAIRLIIPVSISTSLGIAATLTKSVLLKFGKTNKLVSIYILYFIIFISLGFVLSKSIGVEGFAIANLAARAVLCFAFCVLLIGIKKKGEKTSE